MADNTATIFLEGEVSLDEFAKAVSNFNELMNALSEESGGGVEWLLDDLSVSSAMAAARGVGDEKRIQISINNYSNVGQALQSHTEIRYSERVRAAANKVVLITDRRIKNLRFETEKREVLIPLRHEAVEQAITSNLEGDIPLAAAIALSSGAGAFSAVQGRIQTLTSRGRLRFTLYDLFYDKAVSCYFAEGKQELIRGLWGKLAVIEGFVSRDPITGRPLSIRQVSNITPLPEPGGQFDYQQARGIVPSIALSPEAAIRRIRDAE